MVRAALIQMRTSAHVADNLRQVEELMKQACDAQACLVLLPENFAFMGFNETDKLKTAEVYDQGPIQQKISQLARYFSMWVIAGTIALKGLGSKVRASCLVYDNQGKRVARYDKIHLFDVNIAPNALYHESMFIERGQELAVVDTPLGKIGLTICYDVRFPELFNMLRLQGAQLFAIPSAFTEITGVAHWEVLLRARAIENLCYVLAANQGGLHENGRATYGHSMCVDPWGTILAQNEGGVGVITADIDLQAQQKLRQSFPCLEHHVLNLKV